VPHVGKTDAERRSYVEQIVQGDALSTTVATSLAPEGAGTNSPLPEGEEMVRRPAPSRRRNARKAGWLERNRDDLIKWLITVVFLGGIAASLSFTYVLNREVGEMQSSQKGSTRDIDDLRGRMGRFEDRLEKLRDLIQPVKRNR
jgi:hypothetical protein